VRTIGNRSQQVLRINVIFDGSSAVAAAARAFAATMLRSLKLTVELSQHPAEPTDAVPGVRRLCARKAKRRVASNGLCVGSLVCRRVWCLWPICRMVEASSTYAVVWSRASAAHGTELNGSVCGTLQSFFGHSETAAGALEDDIEMEDEENADEAAPEAAGNSTPLFLFLFSLFLLAILSRDG
jgi:hypothetical protein